MSTKARAEFRLRQPIRRESVQEAVAARVSVEFVHAVNFFGPRWQLRVRSQRRASIAQRVSIGSVLRRYRPALRVQDLTAHLPNTLPAWDYGEHSARWNAAPIAVTAVMAPPASASRLGQSHIQKPPRDEFLPRMIPAGMTGPHSAPTPRFATHASGRNTPAQARNLGDPWT